MDNQHRKITGYRELDQSEIDMMNKIKSLAEEVGEMTDRMRDIPIVDQRWLSIGITDLQKGFMAVTRSVAKPESF